MGSFCIVIKRSLSGSVKLFCLRGVADIELEFGCFDHGAGLLGLVKLILAERRDA